VPETLEAPQAVAPEVAVSIVDCDIHPLPQSGDELVEYLPEPYRSMPKHLHSSTSIVQYQPPGGSFRHDAEGDKGLMPGSDPELTAKQLFAAGVDIGLLLPIVRTFFDPDHEVGLCAATNDWLAATWLSKYNAHGRWRGTISVCPARPEASAREIERWAGHPQFVAVKMNAYAGLPFGDPFYDPIYEAATRAGLPVSVHFTKGSGLSLLTPVGYLSYFSEVHGTYPMTYGAHVVSLICNGTFDRFPTLRYIWIEGGYSWCVPLLWRLEKQWDSVRSEHRDAKRRPRDYMLDHMWWTSQPIEEPARLSHLSRVMEWADAEHTLLFSTDYPHWDYDEPSEVLRRLPKSARDRVFFESAIELLGLPRTRPA
jgi:uncharacterized protein